MKIAQNKRGLQLVFCCLLFLLFINPNFVDAAKAKVEKEPINEQPISVFADYIHYDKVSGDLFAEGNVRLVRDDQVVLADRIDGNVNSADIWTKTQTQFKQGSTNTDVSGDKVDYNYESKTGKIEHISGKTGNQYVKANDADIFPEKIVVHDGMMSRCSAKNTKCYHITAERVDIWPDDRMVAYNAKIYILGKKIITRSRYTVSLTGDKTEVPRVGYSNDHGVYIKQTFSFPVDYKTSIGVDLFAGTKVGGRSTGWVRRAEKNFSLEYAFGYYEDSDSEWLKKEHNITFKYHPQRLFNLPLKYNFWFERGLWKGNNNRSWHTEIGAYLRADTIYFGASKSMWLNLGTGYRRLTESLNDIKKDEFRYDIGLNKRFSDKWQVGAVYSKIINNVNLFEYNKIDVPQSLTYTIRWQPDHLNTLEFLQQYDTSKSRVYKNRITYTRNLHCWDFTIYFERERPLGGRHDNKIRWEVHLAI